MGGGIRSCILGYLVEALSGYLGYTCPRAEGPLLGYDLYEAFI
jgi:hypothetical protein